MTCKDCVHHDLCFDNGTLFINFTTTGRKAENVETNCPFKNFKNKSEFVEVVRCKNCKYQDECLQKVDCEYLNREIFYCSYGERSDT